jgi:hypothetical protein
MQSPIWEKWKMGATSSLSVKCEIALALLLLSTLVVACGTSTTGASVANLGGSQSTVTIKMDGNTGSPTPALPGEWCGSWVTNPTPSSAAITVAVYAKFTKNVNGNPQGIGGATGTARVMWTPNDVETYTGTTTSDGLVVFPVSITNKGFALNTITLVTVTFQKAGMQNCVVDQDRAAFFTLIHVTPTPGAKKTPTPKTIGTPTQGGATPTVTSTGTPTSLPPGVTPTPTVKGH